MHKDKYVFALLAEFLDCNKFNYIVKKHDGNKYVKSYTCWNQLLTMMFGQLSGREGLRDLVVAMEVHSGQLYHLGLGKSVTRSNLAKANEERDYRIFEEFALFMIEQARTKRKTDIFKLQGSVYAFDSTTIRSFCERIGSEIEMGLFSYFRKTCNFCEFYGFRDVIQKYGGFLGL